MPRLAVVTPLASEEGSVDELLARTIAQLAADDRMYCVLDNACKDRTREKVQAFSRADPRVVEVWAPQNRCAVDAYFAGYRAAFDAGSSWILEMDGGLSHLPEEIPRFVAAMSRGVEFAGGSRFMKGSVYSGRLSRRIVSQGGTLLTNLLVGTRMTDMTSGFECFSRLAMQRVLDRRVRSRAHFFQTEIRAMMHDLRWEEIPITYSNPSKSVGGATIREAFRNLWLLRADRRRQQVENSP